MSPWLIPVVLLVAALAGAVAGVVSLFIGGVGVTRALAQHISSLDARLLDFDERLTRDQKKRAGITAQAKPSQKHLEEEAAARLASDAAAPSGRPSVAALRARR